MDGWMDGWTLNDNKGVIGTHATIPFSTKEWQPSHVKLVLPCSSHCV
jgi:hypothetical protein